MPSEQSLAVASDISSFVGMRYAVGRGARRFTRMVTLFGLFGMMMGVMVLIIVLSVMNGFNTEMRQRVDTVLPDATLVFERPLEDSAQYVSLLRSHPDVTAVSPSVEEYALLRIGDRSRVLEVIGIDPNIDQAVVNIQDTLVTRSPDALSPDSFSIVIGEVTARQLGVYLGDRIDLILPKFSVTPAGLFPRSRSVIIAGVFSSGSQVDDEIGFMHIDDLRRVAATSLGAVERLRIATVNGEGSLESIQNQLSRSSATDELGNVSLENGLSRLETLFAAMQMEKVVVSLMLCAVVLVAAFNIVSGLVLMVADKRSDIAIMRTFGATSSEVMRIFVTQGLLIGCIGISVGAALGTLIALNINATVNFFQKLFAMQIFDPSVYYIVEMPSEWRLSDFVVIVLAAVTINLLATLFPAWRASRIAPAEALSYQH